MAGFQDFINQLAMQVAQATGDPNFVYPTGDFQGMTQGQRNMGLAAMQRNQGPMPGSIIPGGDFAGMTYGDRDKALFGMYGGAAQQRVPNGDFQGMTNMARDAALMGMQLGGPPAQPPHANPGGLHPQVAQLLLAMLMGGPGSATGTRR